MYNTDTAFIERTNDYGNLTGSTLIIEFHNNLDNTFDIVSAKLKRSNKTRVLDLDKMNKRNRFNLNVAVENWLNGIEEDNYREKLQNSLWNCRCI